MPVFFTSVCRRPFVKNVEGQEGVTFIFGMFNQETNLNKLNLKGLSPAL